MSENGHSQDSVHSTYALFVLLLAYILSFIDRNVMAVLIGPIREDFAINDTQFGLLHGLAFALLYTTVGLPIARLADTKSRRNIITLGVFFWSLMTCWCGVAKSFTGLFFARMGVGLGEAALSPPAWSMIADLFSPKRLPIAMSLLTMGVPIGAGMAFIVGGWVYGYFIAADPVILPIVGQLGAWQLTFIAVGIPGFLVVLLLLPIREPIRMGKLQSAGEVDPPQLSIPEVLAYVKSRKQLYGTIFGSISLLTILGYATMTWYLESMIRSFGAEREVLGPQMGQMFIIAGIAGALSGGWFASYLQNKGYRDANMRIIVIAAILWIIPGVLAPLAPNAEIGLWAISPVLFLLSSYIGVAIAGLQLVTPNQMRSQLSAVLVLTTNLVGLGLGPVIVGFFTDFVFGNEADLRYSLSLLAAIACPLAAIWAGVGLKHYRAALEEAQVHI